MSPASCRSDEKRSKTDFVYWWLNSSCISFVRKCFHRWDYDTKCRRQFGFTLNMSSGSASNSFVAALVAALLFVEYLCWVPRWTKLQNIHVCPSTRASGLGKLFHRSIFDLRPSFYHHCDSRSGLESQIAKSDKKATNNNMSSLPPTLNFAEAEEEIVKKWKEENSFHKQNELSLERGDEVCRESSCTFVSMFHISIQRIGR